MSRFRISLGVSSCAGWENKRRIERDVCGQVLAQLERLRSLSEPELKEMPAETGIPFHLSGDEISIKISRVTFSDGQMLLVVQAFLPTWIFPNYFSFGAVGKMFVEGLLFKNGCFHVPEDSLLWSFR